MKRFLGVIFCFVLLCGCAGKSRAISPVVDGIAFCATVNFYNEVYECDTTIDNEGTMNLAVRVPDDLSGLKVSINENGITAEYLGLTYTPKTENLPLCGVAQTLYRIIGEMRDKVLVIRKDENCLFEGRIDDRAYTFCCAPSGLPLYIEIPDDSYRIEFSNIKIM